MRAYLVVDDQAWMKLTSIRPTLAAPSIESIRFDVAYNTLPVIRSPYITTTCDYDPPRILKDFDRWFNVKLMEIGWRREEAKARRMRQSLDSSML